MILDASCNYFCHPSTGRAYGVICYNCKATVFLRLDGTIEIIRHSEPPEIDTEDMKYANIAMEFEKSLEDKP